MDNANDSYLMMKSLTYPPINGMTPRFLILQTMIDKS